jgi:hypothetical protein
MSAGVVHHGGHQPGHQPFDLESALAGSPTIAALKDRISALEAKDGISNPPYTPPLQAPPSTT